MFGNESLVYILENHHIEELATEVEPCCGRRHGTFIGGKDCLEVDIVLRHSIFPHPFRERNVSQTEQSLLEILIAAVVEESQCPSPGRGVVNYLGNEAVVTEIKLVADADFPGRLDDDIPESLLLVKFPEEEHLDVCTCLLLLAQKSGREYLGVIEDECVTLSEVVNYVLENLVLYFSRILVKYHHPALVTPLSGRFVGNVLLEGDWKLKLR